MRTTLFVFEKNPLAVLGRGDMRILNVLLQICVGCKPVAAQHAMQRRGQPRFQGELVQVRAMDVGAWYITWFVMTAESLEDAFTVLAQEVFVDVLVEFA